MQVQLEQQEKVIIGKVAEAAKHLSLPAFVVGGFVRDKLLGRPCKDIDIVCLGDAIALANKVSELFHPHPKVSWFKKAELLPPFWVHRFSLLFYVHVKELRDDITGLC